MTTQEKDMTEPQRAPDDAPVAGGPDAAADNTQTGAIRAAAEPSMPTLGGLQAVCRAVVKRLFGKRHWAAPWALELCAADAQFLPHLAEQSRGYAHFLCLIRLALLERGGAGGAAQEVARLLRADGNYALFCELFPSSSVEILKLLPKLPKKPFRKEVYPELLRALEDKKVCKFLLRRKRVSKSAIYSTLLIEHVPVQYRCAAMHLLDCHNFYDEFFRFLKVIKTIEKFNLQITEREFVKTAKKKRSTHMLMEWMLRQVAELPFPPPPWEGDDKIRPVRSRSELKEMAAKIDNHYSHRSALDRHASHIVAGDVYVYVCEHIPAMIEIRRDRDVYTKWAVCGWSIGAIGGKGDKHPSLFECYELTRAFVKFQHANIFPVVYW